MKTNSVVNIIVIDSGVKLSHPAFDNISLQSYELANDEDEFKRIYSDNDSFGHGTAICGLIVKSLQKQDIDVSITMIKAFDNINANCRSIEKALDFVNQYFAPDVLNLSFGITDDSVSSTIDLCNELSKKCIILSAADNSGFISVPCSLPYVIGVASHNDISNPLEYYYCDSDVIQILAYGKNQRVNWIGPEYCFMDGNSLACANVTGIVAGLICKYGSKNIIEVLHNCATKILDSKVDRTNYCIKHPFQVKKAAIFPFNKETSSLTLFSDLLNFEIVDIYDIPMSCKIGAKVSDILKLDVPQDFIIKNISDFDTKGIDTLILGHIDEYLKYPKEFERIKRMISKCTELQIYSFDPVSNSDRIFSPIISTEYIPPIINGGMLHYIHTPVVAVLGTSSKQGKFTLQLQLRKSLIMRGYNVGQIGTEPQSSLFGIDSTYAMGYNSNIEFSDSDTILYINRILHEIECSRDVDIIITGSQSGTVPYSYGHLSNYTLSQQAFLLGVRPDAVVLCVNVFDDFSYINRTIKYIESIINTKIVSLVLYPRVKSNLGTPNSETSNNILDVREHCKLLQQHFNLPTYILGENTDKLSDEIINYFS